MYNNFAETKKIFNLEFQKYETHFQQNIWTKYEIIIIA